MKKALIIVDAQKDFCKGGALEVPNGDSIMHQINHMMITKKYDLIVATLDWHPLNHSSFKRVEMEGIYGIWPDHCVAGSYGAELHDNLSKHLIQKMVCKGTSRDVDSYSGFFDNNKLKQTELDFILKNEFIEELDIVGLALDYCVKATAIDAIDLGYKVNLYLKATKAVNINPEDGDNAIKELKSIGVNIIE